MRTIALFLLIALFTQQLVAQRKHWIKAGESVKKDIATHYYTLTKTETKTFLYQEYDKLTDSLFQEINYPTKELLIKEGEYKRYFENGTLAVKGAYLKNQKTGVWIFYDKHSNKQTEIIYKQSLKEGYYTEYYKGKVSSVYRYKSDSLHSLVQLNDTIGNNLFKEDTSDRAVYSFVDQEAIFSGVKNELNYLLIDSSVNNNTKRVYITFNVSKQGKVTEVMVDKLTKSTDLEQECKEALIKVALLPNWKEPAMKRGRLVKSRHKCEIVFN